jgi:hypothetical protein
MFFAVYVSSAVRLFNNTELAELLEVSRRNNAKAEITGMLLYKDGNFMQFLEGPKENVCSLLERIKEDPRHRGMIVLMQAEHEARDFSDWSMGFKTLDDDELPSLPGYSDFLDLPLTSEQFLLNPSKSLRLLLTFKDNMR